MDHDYTINLPAASQPLTLAGLEETMRRFRTSPMGVEAEHLRTTRFCCRGCRQELSLAEMPEHYGIWKLDETRYAVWCRTVMDRLSSFLVPVKTRELPPYPREFRLW